MPLNLHISEKTSPDPLVETQVSRVLPLFDHIIRFSREWIVAQDDEYCYCYIEESEIEEFCSSFSWQTVADDDQLNVILDYLKVLRKAETLYVRID